MKLKDYARHQRELNALRDKAIDQRFSASRDEAAIAKQANDLRLNGMNEFRDSLRDQATRFVTSAEFQSEMKNLAAQVASLQNKGAIGQGALEQSDKNSIGFRWFLGACITAGLGLAGLINAILRR